MKNLTLTALVVLAMIEVAYSKTTSEYSLPEGVNLQITEPFTGLKKDIPVGIIGDTELLINIALPQDTSKTPRPVLLFIHGGGLIKGNKDLLNNRIRKMAKRGIVAASAMYRLAPEHRFPAAIEDIKAAIRFLKAHAQPLNIDPQRIVVSGASAGGYLAVMVGVTGNASGFTDHGIYPDFDSSISAVISHAPPIADYSKAEFRDFVLVERFINTAGDRQKALGAMSPITYLDKQDPPFFLSHGTADERVPVDMTREFAAALEAMGQSVVYIEVEGGKHSLNRSRPEKASEVFQASMNFFNRYTERKG